MTLRRITDSISGIQAWLPLVYVLVYVYGLWIAHLRELLGELHHPLSYETHSPTFGLK